jgi:hypothetical protein
MMPCSVTCRAFLGCTTSTTTREGANCPDALENLRRELASRNIVFGLAPLKYELARILAAAGFLDRIGEDRVYATLPTAVEAYHKWCRAQPPGVSETTAR